MTGLWREFAFALRQFRHSPGLAAGVAVTIGLGVGATLAVFALLVDAFLPASPYHEPDRLAIVENTGMYYFGRENADGFASPEVSGPDFRDLSARQHVFSSAGALDESQAVMGGTDRPHNVGRFLVTASMFDVLEVQPIRGRLPAAADFEEGAPGVAVISEGLWRAYFGSDPAVAGRKISLDEQPFTIVGVLPADVFGLLVPRRGLFEAATAERYVVTPLVAGLAGEAGSMLPYHQTHRDSPWLRVVARLRPGVTLENAQSEMNTLAASLHEENPATYRNRGLRLVPLAAWRTAGVRELLWMLSVAAVLAFLVACANAAGLVMADSVKREPELAVRQALGAGPAQLLQVVLARSLLWSLPGAVLGFAFGAATLALVRWGALAGSESLRTIRFGPAVVAAGLVLTLIAGLATGGVAAWTLRRRNLVESLREGGQTASTGRRRSRAATILVALQIAVAATLAIGSGLLVRSMWNVVSADRGFDLEHGFAIQVRLPRSKYPGYSEQAVFYRRALDRIRAMGGIASAGVSAAPPLTGYSVGLGGMEVTTPTGAKELPGLAGQFVTSGYFESMGMGLVLGRFFSAQDDNDGHAIVVSEAFCRSYLDGADPLATVLRFGKDKYYPIVGVVRDIQQATGPESAAAERRRKGGMVYLPFTTWGSGAPTWSFLVVRANENPARLTGPVMRELLTVDEKACLDDPRTFAQLFAARTAERRRLLGLLGSFAVIVLLLTMLSLAAALSQYVAFHARDIAIRLAVGASRGRVAALTTWNVAAALGAGLALGAVGGLLLARALASQLYRVEPTDAATIAGAIALLAFLSIVAAAGPVWRASRIDPYSTLRAL